jgi:N-acetylglucosaminyldiphosphoundecaprenol N-acetyl-beta-D-mannosaminyltransferase
MRQSYFNIFLDILDRKEAREKCERALLSKSCNTLFFVNAHCFNVAQTDDEYRRALNSADLIFNDGVGLAIGSIFANVKFKDNLNGTDFIPTLIESYVQYSKKIYLVGGKVGIAEKAKALLEERYKGINIAGIYHGFFSIEEEKMVIEEINTKKVDVLIVGMGVPKQELWITAIKDKLETVKICVAGGAIIDFIAGNVTRAPKWMRAARIEWLYRLVLEPKRLWRRYLIGNFKFLYNVIFQYTRVVR